MPLTADEIRRHLGLEPHPEGGSYVQTFRDNQSEWPEGGVAIPRPSIFFSRRAKSRRGIASRMLPKSGIGMAVRHFC